MSKADKEFEEKWNKAVRIAQEKITKDGSIKDLLKHRDDLLKRVQKIEAQIEIQRQKTFYEELKNQLTHTSK